MMDESTDISVLKYLIMFATFFEDGLTIYVFFYLLHILGNRKDASIIYKSTLTFLNQWSLYSDKFMGFGSDGTFVIMKFCNEMATCLKDKINPFILSIHCVAYRTNIIFLDAANNAICKILLTYLII